MKTDYFSTFLDTLNDRPTAISQPVSAPAASTAAPVSLDINLLLKALDGKDIVSLAELVRTTLSSPGALIATIQQMSAFGLVHYDTSGVGLTEQGKRVVTSTPVT